MRSKDAILQWWQNFFSEDFGQSGRIILKAVGNTAALLSLPAGSEQILRSSHKHNASPPSPPPPGGAGGWRESPNSRHSTTNKAVRRRQRSTLKIYRINNKVEWKVKYASLSYFTG